jgi:NADP-dependent aldehyde dehydrogenase
MEWEALSAPLEAHLASSPLSLMLSPGLRDGFEKSLDEMSVGQGVVTLVAGTDGEVPTPTVLGADADAVRQNPDIIRTEMFGPASVVVRYRSEGEFAELVGLLEGQLTATVQGEDDDEIGDLVESLRERSGRILWNGWPTGVTVSYAQEHGGPYPATTASGTTSVGTAAIARFLRPVAYQSFPSSKLPPALQDDNPWGIERRVDGGSPTVV